jgi:hypothetical protein
MANARGTRAHDKGWLYHVLGRREVRSPDSLEKTFDAKQGDAIRICLRIYVLIPRYLL